MHGTERTLCCFLFVHAAPPITTGVCSLGYRIFPVRARNNAPNGGEIDGSELRTTIEDRADYEFRLDGPRSGRCPPI